MHTAHACKYPAPWEAKFCGVSQLDRFAVMAGQERFAVMAGQERRQVHRVSAPPTKDYAGFYPSYFWPLGCLAHST